MSLKFLSPIQLNIKNHLAILPLGDLAEHKIQNWSIEDLKPYVSYILQDKSIDTMFGGLIFNPISSRPNHYIYPMYATLGELATIEDWRLAIDDLFKINYNFHAACLSGRKLDIWVMLPYPLTLQNDFGVVDNVNLNFNNHNDRLVALKWWINNFLEGWQKATYLHGNLTFKGFVWQRDGIFDEDSQLVIDINNFIRQKNYLSMWLPNYGSNGITDWKKFGFDITCINSNYYGNTNNDYQWINYASAFGKFYHTGMQINYGKGLIYNQNHLTDYLNLGLPQYNNYMNDCVVVYKITDQTLNEVYKQKLVDYIRIYSFIKGIYSKVAYPLIPY
ncbi:DUF4855 domain-containing protein [Alkaliphilus transvaalensis]|uniref:DUF4855 domain-containing protein n=1 Tax=Alkaliphilus transvaalensis TaxID=114628 RepID=UPI00047930A0|nr:DUF4855 domain-containing protein [Alkaliphilus transvaalensis]